MWVRMLAIERSMITFSVQTHVHTQTNTHAHPNTRAHPNTHAHPDVLEARGDLE